MKKKKSIVIELNRRYVFAQTPIFWSSGNFVGWIFGWSIYSSLWNGEGEARWRELLCCASTNTFFPASSTINVKILCAREFRWMMLLGSLLLPPLAFFCIAALFINHTSHNAFKISILTVFQNLLAAQICYYLNDSRRGKDREKVWMTIFSIALANTHLTNTINIYTRTTHTHTFNRSIQIKM
jgi:hypothetical protein